MGAEKRAKTSRADEDLQQIVDDIVVDEIVTTRKLQKLYEAFSGEDQNEECRLLCVRATRHLLNTNAQHTADKEHKLLFGSTLVHALWQEAAAAEQPQSELQDFLSDEELQVMYEQLIKMFPLVADSNILSTIAEFRLFIQILDLPNAEKLQKALFKAVFRACAEMPTDSETYTNCLSLCVSFLEEGDDSILPALELVLDHLSSFRIADRDCPAVRFLYDLLHKTEQSISPLLRSGVQTRLAAQTLVEGKQKSALLSSSQLVANLIHHLTAALPSLMTSLVPPAATDMANATEKDALDAFELLQLQISAPNPSTKRHETLVRQFLDSGDNASQRVRLKFVNALSGCLSLPTALSPSMLHEVEQTLVLRFWDPVPAVRAAAIRSMVSFTAAWGEDEHGGADAEGLARSLDAHLDVLDKLILRLMDSVPDVREEAMKASLPALSACIHVAASTSDDSDLGPLRGPSELVKRIGVIFSKLLHGVSHGANRRLLVQLGEAPGMALIPTTGNTRFDAWLLVHLLSNAECTNLLRSLLDWQNGLRVSLSSLLSARKDAAQADRTERADAQKRVDTAVANLVKHWSAAMPKGNLTAGALKHLLEQRDNKLFDGITALCVNPHVAPIFPPVFNQKKRGAVRSTHKQSQDDDPVDCAGSDADPVATDAANKSAEGVIEDLRQRLRARSKEVLVLVRIAALNILSPAHIQAVLEIVGEVPDETLKRSTLPAELQLVQTAVGAIRKAMTMMLKGLGNDLLYSAVHGTGLRCCFALILASSGMRIITPVAMMPANQSSVLKMLQEIVEEGPPRCAKALARAALALLPQAIAVSVVQQLVGYCMDIMRKGRTDAAAVNAVHVLCDISRTHPSLVAGDLAAIVTWVFDGLLPSEAPEAAAARPGAALTVKTQLAHGTIKDLPMPLHHRTALLAALAKSIAEGWRTTGSATDRAAAAAALEAFVPRTLAVMNPDAELNGFQADAPLERGALRLAAADALLKVGSRLDKELPGQAFVEMGLVMQDELVEVQSAFAAIIHRTITNHYKHLVAAGTQRMASPDAVALGKYVSMLSLAVEWKTDFSEPLSKLVLWLHTWNRHTADAADHVTADAAEDSSRRARKAKADEGGDGRKGGKKGRTAGSMLPTLPEYSLFFLIYILSHHDDFPTPEMLAEYSEKSVSGEGTSRGEADQMNPGLLAPFERMLSFQIHALLATAQQPARTLALIKFFMRIISHATEDAEGDTHATQAQQLLADMALRITLSAVDAETTAAASEMLQPGNCHIPSRLFRRRDGAGHTTDPVRVPSWHTFQELPKNLSQIITKALSPSNTSNGAAKGNRGATAAQGGAGRSAKAGGSGRAAKGKGGKSDRSRSRGRARAAAVDDVDEVDGGTGAGGGSDVEKEDGPQRDDAGDSDFQDGGATRGRSRSKPAAKRSEKATGAKGRTASAARAGGKDSKKPGGSGGRKPVKKRAAGKAGGTPSTPGTSAQQTLLSPFGAQKLPDVSSPAGSGSKRARPTLRKSHGSDGGAGIGGSGGNHGLGGQVSDEEGSDDGGHMHDSDAQGALMHAGADTGNAHVRKAAVAARNMSHVSEDEVSDSECALPVKRRAVEATKPKGVAANKAAHPTQARSGASPVDVGDEEDEHGSDVDSPLSAVPVQPSNAKPQAKKRSKAQLDSEEPPSAGQDAGEEDGGRKRSKGSDAGRSGGQATAGRRGKGNGDVLMDLDDDADAVPARTSVPRTVKKKLFQPEPAQGEVQNAASGRKALAAHLESADEQSDGEGQMEVDEGDVGREHETAKRVVSEGENDQISNDGEAEGEPGGGVESDESPQQEESPSDKENRRRSPCGKSGGKEAEVKAHGGNGGLKGEWKSRKVAEKGNLQQIVDKEVS